jgi:poly(hydroxyalkanoate) depolymerase family esterase
VTELLLKRSRPLWVALGFAASCFASATANAASLQQVNNWGVPGLPTDVSMFAYVPDHVAASPPILTLIHYCGGTASAVFGQAQGGGIVSAADQYGFILVVPSSGRCWDVESDKAWTRDGGGDSQAIKQMVTYAIGKYGANANRVYSTGDSSGGMMTELLLALYPDIFKAGSAFAGMPAGCRGANESGTNTGYSGACAGGNVTHTPQEWGAIVDKMDPGYVGHRPRVQLFHGDADGTINYKNFGESIKEWTDVLGLATNPTSTTANITLGMHKATRQQWNNACGYLVLDGFTSIGGDHGPSDALFDAQYVIPFLGLDKTGAVDPEIAQCGSGSGGSGGGGGQGGGGASSGGVSAGGAANFGGSGNAGPGGTGGGGAGISGGGLSGESNAGGGGALGGYAGASAIGGGTSGSSGMSGAGGSPSAGVGGSMNSGGAVTQPHDSNDTGCSCALAEHGRSSNGRTTALSLGFGLLALARRRRRVRAIKA